MTLTLNASTIDTRGFMSAKGSWLNMATREDTMDFDVCMSSIQEDEYRLGPRAEMTGWALDVGAHIGAVTCTLAKDNPQLRVIAVEIVPENVEMLRRNIEVNGVANRVTIVEAAAGGPDETTRTCYMRHRSSGHPAATDAYVDKHRYIGNSFWNIAARGEFQSEAVDISVISLDKIIAEHTGGKLDFLKIDCEGCEWAFLDTPAVAKVQTIIGEYHWDYRLQGDTSRIADDAQAEIARLLGTTHTVSMSEHPSIGLFEAVRK